MIGRLWPWAAVGLLAWAASAPAAEFYPVADSADPAALNIGVRILPDAGDVGREAKVYVLASVAGACYALGATGWVAVADPEVVPAYGSLTLAADQTLPLLGGIPAAPLDGAALFVGYGGSLADAYGQGKYDLVYTVSAQGADDPLYAEQWHLHNRGQSAFSYGHGTPGEDLRVEPLHRAGILGRAATVAVVDGGLEIAHPDLVDNVVAGGSHNFITGSDDPSPDPDDTEDGHGTSVAGILAARGWNNIGGRGAAPEARLKGFNFMLDQSMESYAASLGGGSYAQDVWVFNQSFNQPSLSLSPLDPVVEAVLAAGTTKLRGGKGAIYVKSAGNGFVYNDGSNQPLLICAAAHHAGTSCDTAQVDHASVSPQTLVVGALDANGVHASYSTAGANLLLSAPGGETGIDKPAVVTTDLGGCRRGYAMSSLPKFYPPFNRGGDLLRNPVCAYNAIMNGTSAAAPNTSGVAALMLSVNLDLSWRDVRHILIATARKIDGGNTGTTVDLADPYFGRGGRGTYLVEYPWTTNAAGYSFHNWYGFGAVDAEAAVAMARDYHGDLGIWTEGAWADSGTLNLNIPDFSVAGATSSQEVPDKLSIEAVQIKLKVLHDMPADLAVELISPAGTRSMLLSPYGLLVEPNIDGALLTNAFYGESCAGTWTLKVTDLWQENEGKWVSWSLRCLGH